jgi:sterol desaturase/sphingolipid hydroxylase (fatty acid hydroxylase superfamily)
MQDFVLEITIDALTGIVAWLLALAFPMRRFAARPEIGWDLLAVIVSVSFAVVAGLLFDPLTDWISTWLDAWYALIETAPWWVIAPSYVVLADFGAYWAHRALHTRTLWHTHAWHHSPRYLYWLSGLRGSPLHVIILVAPYFLAFMVFPVEEAVIAVIALAILDGGNQNLIHSNVKLPLPRLLERVLVTPRYHFVHHNAQIEIANSNFGFLLSIWDRTFGTYTDPETVPVDAPLGLSYAIDNWRLAVGLPASRAAPVSGDRRDESQARQS